MPERVDYGLLSGFSCSTPPFHIPVKALINNYFVAVYLTARRPPFFNGKIVFRPINRKGVISRLVCFFGHLGLNFVY